MSEEKGHFENGVWIHDPEPAATRPDTVAFDRRFADATTSVIASINDVMNVTHDLVTTKEGKQFIEKTVADTQAQVRKSFDDIIRQVKEEVEKKRKKA
ncbi:MAG TPA: hypothetical protein P5217_06955 [Methanoregulaceae archaeon]|nr:hypothetical protein [Methanoregulaceae archaeon]